MDRSLLRSQIQRVLDSGEGETRSVIVQMATPEQGRRGVAESAAEAVRQRSLALTARDCLPVQLDSEQQATATPRPQVRADAAALLGSLSTQVHAPHVASGALKAQAIENLRPLLDNERSRRLIEASGEKAGENTSEQLWASSALALDAPIDDLVALADEVDGIVGIYPNRSLHVPSVAEVHNFPPQVLENRASSWGVERIGALATWGAYGARGAGSRVAVLDTGVDESHPDLSGKIELFAEFDAAGHQTGAAAYDGDRHGTHVCGTIAGGNSGGQWIGVAPEAKLLVGKVLDSGGGTDRQVLAGMTWAIEQQVDVISMSLGGFVLGPETPPTYTNALVTAVQRGIPVVVAIGNEGSQTSGSPGSDLFALSVGATDYRGVAAGFSGGRTQLIKTSAYIDPQHLPLPYSKPDLCAPGVAIVSSVPVAGSKSATPFEAFNGTSMATPHVTGVVALLLCATKIKQQTKLEERAFLIQDLLIGSVDELGEAGQDHRYGFGRVNALKAIGFAQERGY